MKPLAIYLVRGVATTNDIHTKGWKHLLINGKLPLMPTIVAKSSDFMPKSQKKKFRIYLSPSIGVKQPILESLKIDKVLILDS
jgi:hypothetical protein